MAWSTPGRMRVFHAILCFMGYTFIVTSLMGKMRV